MTPSPDNVAHLRQAAARKSAATMSRVQQTLREFDESGRTVSVAAIAKAASVSRSWIYETPEALEAINLRRAEQQRSGPGIPAAQTASEASLRSRLETALDDNRRLRDEIKQLRGQLAEVHGARLDALTGGAA